MSTEAIASDARTEAQAVPPQNEPQEVAQTSGEDSLPSPPEENVCATTVGIAATDEDSSVPSEPFAKEEQRPPRNGWTFIAMAVGIALIACSMLVPEADDNQRLVYDCEKLRLDLVHLQKQVEANQKLIDAMGADPVLAERLAQRQLKFVRRGLATVPMDEGAGNQSVFALAAVPAEPELPQFQLSNRFLLAPFRGEKSRLYLIGGGLMLVACGLVLGGEAKSPE